MATTKSITPTAVSLIVVPSKGKEHACVLFGDDCHITSLLRLLADTGYTYLFSFAVLYQRLVPAISLAKSDLCIESEQSHGGIEKGVPLRY